MVATDFDFSETRNDLILGGLRKLGAIGFGSSLSGDEMTNAANALNELIKEWQTKDIFLWQLKVVTLSLTANNASVALPTDPGILGIDSAAWVNGTSHDPIEVITWRKYQAIETKADQGYPDFITVDNMRNGTVYVYPVPTVNITLRLIVISKLKDWDAAAGNGDFPEHWMLAIKYGLAALLCDDYGLPLAERNKIEGKANYYFLRAKVSDKDRETRTVVKGSYD